MIVRVNVHEFSLGDVEDPAIYAAQPIYEWQKTESGKWVMEHSVPEPHWNIGFNYSHYGYRVMIIANLQEHDATFYQLKYGLR